MAKSRAHDQHLAPLSSFAVPREPRARHDDRVATCAYRDRTATPWRTSRYRLHRLQRMLARVIDARRIKVIPGQSEPPLKDA